MKSDTVLTITSLLAIVLMSLHLTDDVVRGIEPGGLENLIGVLILAVWLYATLVLARRRWGYAILLLGSIFAALMPVVHLSGEGVGGDFTTSSGAFFSIWGVDRARRDRDLLARSLGAGTVGPARQRKRGWTPMNGRT